MLGCLFIILRPLATLVLGLVIFVGFLGFLLANNLRGNFLSTEFYTDNLSENNVYQRIYDEVLLDSEFEDTTSDLLGGIDVPTVEIAKLASEIITPQYLQEQVEGAVSGAVEYLNSAVENPEVFIDLSPPLERAKPELFRYIDRRIDALEDVPVATIEELEAELEILFRSLEMGVLPTSVPSIQDQEALVENYVDQSIAKLEEDPVNTIDDFKRALAKVYRQLANGEMPTRIPSIDAIDVSIREAAYDRVFQAVRDDPNIPDEAKKGLEEQEQEIKDQLRAGSIKGALKVASPNLTKPVLEAFVDDAYDRAYQTLKDEGFSENALEGLEEQQDAIKAHLGDGDVKEALKLGARGVAGPLIDEALEELRKDLDDQDRLDLVAKAAEQNDQTREEFLDDLDVGRDVIKRVGLGGPVAILIMVVGLVLMALVHLPHLSSGLRWPGLTLFLSGLVVLIIGLVMRSQLPGQFDNLLDQASADSPIPLSMIDIISDVLRSMASDVANGFITPSIVLLVIGLVMLVGSFVIRLLHIPFLSR